MQLLGADKTELEKRKIEDSRGGTIGLEEGWQKLVQVSNFVSP
jgi:hypothetical protein